jgi:hypothetical protein
LMRCSGSPQAQIAVAATHKKFFYRDPEVFPVLLPSFATS